MTVMEILVAIGRVTATGLVFGAGIPLLFALGMRSLTGATAISPREGAARSLRVLGWVIYAALAVVIAVAIAWVARDAVSFYFGWELFGGL